VGKQCIGRQIIYIYIYIYIYTYTEMKRKWKRANTSLLYHGEGGPARGYSNTAL